MTPSSTYLLNRKNLGLISNLFVPHFLYPNHLSCFPYLNIPIYIIRLCFIYLDLNKPFISMHKNFRVASNWPVHDFNDSLTFPKKNWEHLWESEFLILLTALFKTVRMKPLSSWHKIECHHDLSDWFQMASSPSSYLSMPLHLPCSLCFCSSKRTSFLLRKVFPWVCYTWLAPVTYFLSAQMLFLELLWPTLTSKIAPLQP